MQSFAPEREPRALCTRCLRPVSVCYCAALPRIETATKIVILQHPRERFMPIGTARMASLCLPQTTLLVGTQPGLKFNLTTLTVKAGETVQLVFRNTDDMLHNFVLCAPGKGESVGNAAMALGVDGAEIGRAHV